MNSTTHKLASAPAAGTRAAQPPSPAGVAGRGTSRGPRRALLKAAIFNDDVPWVKDGHIFDKVFAEGRRELLGEMTEMYPERITSANFEEHTAKLRDVEVIFSTWEMPVLTAEQVARMPALKAVFYAAGQPAEPGQLELTKSEKP
jgi:hypothetical protein